VLDLGGAARCGSGICLEGLVGIAGKVCVALILHGL
jgi:hypothetical protein